jgi:ComF family protein
MRVTKFGHSCLLVEVQKARILIDPGNFSTGQETISGLHAILITHEHPDHITLDSVKTILSNNPNALIYTNEGVGKLLSEAGISYQTLENGTVAEIEGVSVRGYGVDHACIHDSIPLIRNTGYMIADAFFYPGDALTQFPQNVEVLALPVAAPWLIWELKFKGRYTVALLFGEVLADTALSVLEDEVFFGESKEIVVIPIPASASGKKKRGYNQSTLLAKAMIAKTTAPMTLLENALIKVRQTTRQSEIKHRDDRLKNLIGAFAIPHHSLKGKVVLLVDDVATTGATIKEARRALRTAGASRIYAITLAH